MTLLRGTAVATALLLAALAAAGCGFGPGADVGSVQLTVTREFGRVPMLSKSVGADESDTVMRLLEGNADIATRYGGGFVRSIDGYSEAERGGHPYDWFYYVNGVEAPIGAAENQVLGGERIWWDYRNWSATEHVPAVVGSWPAPFVEGYEGHHPAVAVECEGGGGACGAIRGALEREGVDVAAGRPKGAIRVLVGPWSRVGADPTAALVEDGPAESGVFARFVERHGGFSLEALDENGDAARDLGPRAGLVAATSRFGGTPVWLVTGATTAAVRAAAGALDAGSLRDHYAVAITAGQVTALPVDGR